MTAETLQGAIPSSAAHWLLVFSALAAVAFFCVGLTSYFERRPERPLWVRGIHDAGMLLSLVHLAAVVILEPRTEGFVMAGVFMYTASVALFLSAIEAATRTRLQRAFIDLPLPDRLITEGPYRWVRHPFYVGYIMGAIAPALAVDHVVVFVVSALMVLLTVAAALREEQVWLSSSRADAYREYRARTGMFVPKLWKR